MDKWCSLLPTASWHLLQWNAATHTTLQSDSSSTAATTTENSPRLALLPNPGSLMWCGMDNNSCKNVAAQRNNNRKWCKSHMLGQNNQHHRKSGWCTTPRHTTRQTTAQTRHGGGTTAAMEGEHQQLVKVTTHRERPLQAQATRLVPASPAAYCTCRASQS